MTLSIAQRARRLRAKGESPASISIETGARLEYILWVLNENGEQATTARLSTAEVRMIVRADSRRTKQDNTSVFIEKRPPPIERPPNLERRAQINDLARKLVAGEICRDRFSAALRQAYEARP